MAREDADAHGRHDPRARAIVLLCVALLSRSGAAAAPSVQLSAPRPLFSRMAKSGRATRNMTLYRVTPVKLRGVADRCILHPSICPLAPVRGLPRAHGSPAATLLRVQQCARAAQPAVAAVALTQDYGCVVAPPPRRNTGDAAGDVFFTLYEAILPMCVPPARGAPAAGWGGLDRAGVLCTVSRCSAPERPGARPRLNARLRGMTVVRCGLLGAQLLPREPERLHLQHHLLGARRYCAQRVRHDAVPSPLALSCKTSAQRVRLQLPSQQNRDRFRFGAGPYA